jgi:hypothetical protein
LPLPAGSKLAAFVTRLPRRSTGASVLVAWVLCAGAASWTAEHHAGRGEQQAEVAALARAEVAAEAIAQSLLRTLEEVEELHDLAQLRQRLAESGDAGGARAIEAQLTAPARRGRFGVLQVAVVGSDGQLVWSSVPGWRRVDLSDREHFQVHRTGHPGLFVSAPLVGRASDQWSVQLTRALRDRAGDFSGVAVVSIDPAALAQTLASLHFGNGSSALVLRQDGALLARSRDPLAALGQTLPSDAPLMRAIAAASAGQVRVPQSIFDGASELVGFRRLADAPLAVAVALDPVQEMAPISFLRPSCAPPRLPSRCWRWR